MRHLNGLDIPVHVDLRPSKWAEGAPVRRDISAGELDALCREHRVTLACSGSHWTASQRDGREARGSVTHRDMAHAVLGLVAKLEGRS